MTKLEIIYELFESKEGYINKPETRAIENGQCCYKASDNKMCAIGKCLIPNEDIYTYFGNVLNLIRDFLKEDERRFDSLLQVKYRGNKKEFWCELQLLHDNECYWKNDGLSEEGIQELTRLKEKHTIN